MIYYFKWNFELPDLTLLLENIEINTIIPNALWCRWDEDAQFIKIAFQNELTQNEFQSLEDLFNQFKDCFLNNKVI